MEVVKHIGSLRRNDDKLRAIDLLPIEDKT